MNGARGGQPDPSGQTPRRRSSVIYIPIAVFVVIAAIFAFELSNGGDNSELTSALLNNPAPEFAMEPLEGLSEAGAQVPGFTNDDFIGQITVVNVFASWCGPCREEHPFITELGEDDRIAVYGINQADAAGDALDFLRRYGNPYDAVGVDPRRRVSIDWGVVGVPETFLVDHEGIVRHRVFGPIGEERLQEVVMPQLEAMLEAMPEV